MGTLGVAPSDLSTRLHLLAGPKGNNVFCFPITLRGNILDQVPVGN